MKIAILLPIAALVLLGTGCSKIQEMKNLVDDSTDSINTNREAVQYNTSVVMQNAQIVQGSTRAVVENRRIIKEVNK